MKLNNMVFLLHCNIIVGNLWPDIHVDATLLNPSIPNTHSDEWYPHQHRHTLMLLVQLAGHCLLPHHKICSWTLTLKFPTTKFESVSVEQTWNVKFSKAKLWIRQGTYVWRHRHVTSILSGQWAAMWDLGNLEGWSSLELCSCHWSPV